ncbi:TetR/AcrR family transcriptional regulator [Bifidobacterium tsurumiense]|uniref:TetR-type transcriptional regulator n=1 Tax=Bifidobacterium tsurumiense TaxID=356829 RepID=A0A087EK08_9BIFI|nr:TetR/AcrR family transcriptional regulator [Bifidobacterium tsurumiense]KFJ08109.1 TetR-type transcriptional regulator [Bifidobacterium tsurumiense]MDY4678184.1 TetR/AcrR family transcriptional regulator [Bifidobacterium tsurumiense]MSS13052.1 TetR/AcrR family transcriptional regulator [Bifidobacterium tsurumiense]
MAQGTKKRIRKDPEERKREIVEVTARLVTERGGFNGLSLKDIAQEVGISQPGLLHYVGNREGLLSLLVTDIYDTSGTPADFMASGLPGSDPDGPFFPAYLRFLVRHNAQRRSLVRLYMVLETEAFNPEHPLYDYFLHRPDSVWEKYSEIPWRIPPHMGSWDANMRPIVRRSLEAMDGIQLRWLREPPIDLVDEWVTFERMIFPSPLWDLYR